MEIRVLRYFLAAAQEENITRAAEKLHLTQPTLSRQLSDLEEELGQVLFLRGKRKITLTEAGRLLQRRAGEILELCEKTEREIRAAEPYATGALCFRRLSPELVSTSFLVWKPHQPMGKACACFLQFLKNAAGG